MADPEPFSDLLASIRRRDATQVRAIIARHPETVRTRYARDILEESISHWLYRGDTALHLAAAGHMPELIDPLVAAGGDAQACGNRRRATPLHYAADGFIGGEAWDDDRQQAAIRALIRHGAAIDARDAQGATPLLRAIRARCPGAVRVLLDSGADPQARNRTGTSALTLARIGSGRGGSGSAMAKDHQARIIDLLLAHSARA